MKVKFIKEIQSLEKIQTGKSINKKLRLSNKTSEVSITKRIEDREERIQM